MEIVTLRTFRSEAEAELAAGYLRDHGIFAITLAGSAGSYAAFFKTAEGARLQVHARDADAARALLADLDDAPPTADEDEN